MGPGERDVASLTGRMEECALKSLSMQRPSLWNREGARWGLSGCCSVTQSCPTLRPHELQLARLLCLCLGRKTMTNLDSTLKSRDITLPINVHLVKAMVFPVVMYGCESWTRKKAEC